MAGTQNPVEGPITIEVRGESLLAVCFRAMASPCEVLLTGDSRSEAMYAGMLAAQEAWRVEKKYSRYRDDSVISWIHRNRGTALAVDEETASLLEFARHCFEISGGLFDITSGVLRSAWKFDGSDRIPSPGAIARLLPLVGFDKLQWQPPVLSLPANMELDLGGIGKEYAVDRAYDLVAAHRSAAFLINFGGDMRANRAPPQGPWQIGIERPDTDRDAAMLLKLDHGALATSGDSHRYLMRDQTRYGHILDPRTGWPVSQAPRSATVAASSCTEAGLLATLALLHGASAETFLAEQRVRHWLLR